MFVLSHCLWRSDSMYMWSDTINDFMTIYGRISVEIYAKPTNSFTYVLPSTCYPRNNINNVPRCIAVRIRSVCDNDEKFAVRSTEYGN